MIVTINIHLRNQAVLSNACGMFSQLLEVLLLDVEHMNGAGPI